MSGSNFGNCQRQSGAWTGLQVIPADKAFAQPLTFCLALTITWWLGSAAFSIEFQGRICSCQSPASFGGRPCTVHFPLSWQGLRLLISSFLQSSQAKPSTAVVGQLAIHQRPLPFSAPVSQFERPSHTLATAHQLESPVSPSRTIRPPPASAVSHTRWTTPTQSATEACTR
ncbi:hypothetical protein LA080_000628 [Diaporthe eres]|nr:hypothetical protein LA080_000628 [Diaporthe eres]